MLELMVLFLLSALLGLACLGFLGWVVVSPESVGVERIFLLLVCALLAVFFLGMAAWLARSTQLKTLWNPPTAKPLHAEGNPSQEKQAAPEETGKPAS